MKRSMLATGLCAALISLTAHGAFAAGAANAETAHSATAPVTVGELELSAPFTRATLPNAPVGGGFLTITNTGEADDRLVSATSPAAGDVQLHEMSMKDGVMEMRALPDGITIPAGESVSLEPGGLHIMFMDLAGPFEQGAEVPVTLTFERAGAVDIALPVRGFGASEAGDDAMTMDDSGHMTMEGDPQ